MSSWSEKVSLTANLPRSPELSNPPQVQRYAGLAALASDALAGQFTNASTANSATPKTLASQRRLNADDKCVIEHQSGGTLT
jgi:hypothetical protein